MKIALGIPLDQLRDGRFEVGLKFTFLNSGSPAIRIWPNESATGSNDYLTNGDAAGRQIAKASLGATSNRTLFLPASFWWQQSKAEANLIFEGISEGRGELALIVKPRDGEEAETATIYLNLLDVRQMYERAKIVNEAEDIPDPWLNDNPPAQTWRWDPWNWQPNPDPYAENITAIFVHGWRMQYWDFMNWSDSSFKRLWHQGFKGKFYSFRWPTYSADNTIFRNNTLDNWQETHTPVKPGGLTYNPSEYRAWLCGSALASWVNQLPNEGRRSLFAHSMGNVIAGAALRAGMDIDNYALCNAAMSAMAYDPDPALRNIQGTNDPLDNIWRLGEFRDTPDTSAIQSIRTNYGLKDKIFEVSNRPVMVNFGLPNDSALGQWTFNNQHFKYDHSVYGYLYTDLFSPPLSQRLPDGTLRTVTSQAEAFAYVTKSLTRTAGAELRTKGAIKGGFHDMSDWKRSDIHSGFGDTHSAQWRWGNHSTSLFWENIAEELELFEK